MKSDVSTKLSTDTAFFSDLISEIKKGEIKVPQFQRKFVWKEEQALELLDSVANRYPIGSILLWKTKEKLNAERNIGNFQLPETDDLTPIGLTQNISVLLYKYQPLRGTIMAYESEQILRIKAHASGLLPVHNCNIGQLYTNLYGRAPTGFLA